MEHYIGLVFEFDLIPDIYDKIRSDVSGEHPYLIRLDWVSNNLAISNFGNYLYVSSRQSTSGL